MCSVLKISVWFALVFATTVSANERSKRSGLVDLGSSVLLPWESSNDGGLRNNIFRIVPGSENLRARNIENKNLNGRNEWQQRQRDLVRLSSAYESRELNQPQSALNSNSIQDSLKQYTNGIEGQRGLQQQNGYSALGAYSSFNSNPSVDEEPALNGKIGQRQSQYSDLTRNQLRNIQFNQQNLDGSDAQSNVQSNKIISLRGQPNRYYNQAIINSNRLRQLSGLGEELFGANAEEKKSLGYLLSQVGQRGVELNQGGLRNSGRIVPSVSAEALKQYSVIGNQETAEQETIQQNNQDSTQEIIKNENGQLSGLGLGISESNVQGLRISGAPPSEQNIGQAYGLLNGQTLVRGNQESLEQINAQQNIQRNYGGYGGRGRFYQSLRSLDNQQLNRPVAQDALSAINIRQYPLEDARVSQRQSAQLQKDNLNLRANPEILSSQLQSQNNVNQQQGNVYTYGELSAKIWNVIKSNPAMISNLDNLREQLLNGNNSGDQQMGQLKSLLQEASNRKIFLPRNIVGQSPEEQERNLVIDNLIGTMNRNKILSNPLNANGQGLHRGWRA